MSVQPQTAFGADTLSVMTKSKKKANKLNQAAVQR
jgi:hypothetical protein